MGLSKQELYDGLIDIYNKTGQGLPGRLMRMHCLSKDIDELVAEGKMQIIEQTYSTLPDDEWFCLTKGYIVEESYSDRSSPALTFMRYYKGIDDTDLGSHFKKDKKLKHAYDTWLLVNKAKLDFVVGTEKMKPSTPLTKKEIAFMKDRKWYTENDIVRICIDEANEGLQITKQLIHNRKRILELMSVDAKYKADVVKNTKAMAEEEAERDMRINIISFLEKQNPDTKVQSISLGEKKAKA